MRSTAVTRKESMDCLVKSLGVLETKVFISSLLRERFYGQFLMDEHRKGEISGLDSSSRQ